MAKKYTKDDLIFLINLNLSNRDFLNSTISIMMSWLLSVTALLVSVGSLLIAFMGFNEYSAILLAILFAVITITWVKISPKIKKISKGAKQFNQQYQDYYFKLYPEKKNTKEYY